MIVRRRISLSRSSSEERKAYPVELNFGSQSRMHFDPRKLREAGVKEIYVTPFQANCESFQDVGTFRKNILFLKEKAEQLRAEWPDVRVAINMFTICHPEGNFRVPERFRPQQNLDGSLRPGFVCFLDRQRQKELLQMYRIIAEEGFDHVIIDDDFRDAFCFCNEHLQKFEPFRKRSRKEIISLFNNPLPSVEEIALRRQWLDFKREGLFSFARKIEGTLHAVNPRLRIGICISAKRCNDLSGRNTREWIALFDSVDAPVFVRLAGEHYTESVIGISQSIGWHQYYRALIPSGTEMMAEVTYVFPVSFKSPALIRLEIAAHLASGEEKVLLAWTDDYQYNGGWKMLEESKKELEMIKQKSQKVTHSLGIAVYAPENCTEYMPLNEVEKGEPIRAYQGFALMGFPVKMVRCIEPSSRLTVLTGYLPEQVRDEIVNFLEQGGVLVIDGLAARSFQRIVSSDIVDYDIGDQISGLRFEKVISTGETIDELAGFPPDAVYSLKVRENVQATTEVISELYDVDNKLVGSGALIYRAMAGWVMVLAYDLSRVHYRVASDAYRMLFNTLFQKVGYQPEVQVHGDLFVQPLLFKSPQRRIILINYNSYQAEVRCSGSWLEGNRLMDNITGEEVNTGKVRVQPLSIGIYGTR